MKRILASLMAVVMLLSLCTFPVYAAEDDVTLTVTPSITEATAGTDAINVIYTVTITPKAGVTVGAAAFHFTVPEGMTLAENKLGRALANKGGNGYWIAAKELQLAEDEDTGVVTGIFNTFEYTPASKYFCAAGASATRNLTSEAVVMTIMATIEAGQTGDFTLSTNDFTVSDPLGNEISGTKVNTTAVTVKAAPIAVTNVTLDQTTLNLDLKNNTTAKLTATVTPDNADNNTVTWSSDKTSVATVDQTGKVTAVAAGTATITAKAGDKTATCTVNVVNCDHTNLTHKDAVSANCTTKGNTEHWSCNDCGALFSDATATTVTTLDAVTIKAAHTLTDVDAKDATCTEDGNIQYWECSVCHDKFSDANGTIKVTNVTVPAAHNLTYDGGKAATCTVEGKKAHYNCSVCGKNFEDANGTVELTDIEIPANGHTYGNLIPATSATCVATGMSAHYQCKVCHAYFDADKSSVGVSDLETAVNPNNHAVALTKTDAKDATCTAAGNDAYWTCGSCNKLFSDAKGNNGITSVPTTSALGHQMTKTEAKAATCTEAGNNEYYTCSRCSKVFKDKDGNTVTTVVAETLKALGHNMTKTEAKAATCTEDGNNEYYYCSVCKTYFKDKDGNTVTNAEAEKIAALGHGDMIPHEKVDATCQKTGVKAHYECGRCHSLFMDETAATAVSDLVIAKIPHDYEDIYNETHHWTFCTNCGATTDKAAHDFAVDEATGTKTCKCGYVVYGEGSATCDQHDTKLVFDEINHWQVCKNCSYAEDKVAHDFGEWETDVEATATTDGLRHRTCKECGYVQQEVIAKLTPPVRPNHRPSGGSSATSSDKVQSSKTFDAGIAAYVGLSVLSLTGSALVIGKKKEF